MVSYTVWFELSMFDEPLVRVVGTANLEAVEEVVPVPSSCLVVPLVPPDVRTVDLNLSS